MEFNRGLIIIIVKLTCDDVEVSPIVEVDPTLEMVDDDVDETGAVVVAVLVVIAVVDSEIITEEELEKN